MRLSESAPSRPRDEGEASGPVDAEMQVSTHAQQQQHWFKPYWVCGPRHSRQGRSVPQHRWYVFRRRRGLHDAVRLTRSSV